MRQRGEIDAGTILRAQAEREERLEQEMGALILRSLTTPLYQCPNCKRWLLPTETRACRCDRCAPGLSLCGNCRNAHVELENTLTALALRSARRSK